MHDPGHVLSDHPWILIERHVETETPIITVSGMDPADLMVACSFLSEMAMERMGIDKPTYFSVLHGLTVAPEERKDIEA